MKFLHVPKTLPWGFLILFGLHSFTRAAPPVWWSEGNPPVVITGMASDPHGVANIGQAKHMAKRALEKLQTIDPDSAIAVAALLVGEGKPIKNWNPPVTQEEKDAQHAPLLIGQLKAIAAPFYSRLHAISPAWLAAQRTANGTNQPGSIYPWATETTDDNNKGIATIGQLKAVFSLRFETLPPPAGGDTPGGGDPGNGNPPGSGPGGGVVVTPPTPTPGDEDGDGLSTEDETAAGADPNAVSPLDPAMVAFGQTSFVIIPMDTPAATGTTSYHPVVVTDQGEVGFIKSFIPVNDYERIETNHFWENGVLDSTRFQSANNGNGAYMPSLPNRAGWFTAQEDLPGSSGRKISIGRVDAPLPAPMEIPWFEDELTAQVRTYQEASLNPVYYQSISSLTPLTLISLSSAVMHVLEDGTCFGELDESREFEGIKIRANGTEQPFYVDWTKDSVLQWYHWQVGGASPHLLPGAQTIIDRSLFPGHAEIRSAILRNAGGMGENAFYIQEESQNGSSTLTLRNATGAVLDNLTAKGFNFVTGTSRNGHVVDHTRGKFLLYDLKTKQVETLPLTSNQSYRMNGVNDQGDLLLQGAIYASLPATDLLLRKFTDPATGEKKWAKCRLNDTKLPEGWSNLKVTAISNSMPLEKQLELAAQTPAAYPVAAEKAPVPMVAGTAVKDGKEIPVGLLPVEIKQRIPDIADDGGETTYEYETVSAVPWDQPTPGVEITEKEISGNQLILTAEIYDALTDVTEGGADLIPKLWINSREEEPVNGDVNGVYRLQGYSYQLFPGRNEVTVSVENALGVSAHHMIVVEGDSQQGYQIVEEPPKFPEHPTYPVVYELSGASFIEEDEKITLELGGKTVEVGREEINGETDESTFRSKPFLSVNEPENATPERIAAIPSDKPVFLAGLDEDLRVELQLSDSGDPVEWTSPQSGLEMTSPEAVEILETGERNLTLQIKARGLGDSPNVEATLETYRGDAAEQDVSGAFQSAYQSAYEALADDAKSDPVLFTVDAITAKDGFNNLGFDFKAAQSPAFQESYHTFRFDSPTKAGVRVFSADLREDIVLDGVTSRPQDIWYPLDGNADLPDFADALIASGCQVVGMTDVNACFDDAPLKRSFMVRSPPGRTFQAFDQLYTAQGRIQRSQTFGATGTNGANLASELSRVQNDAKLPASARNALGLEIAETYQFHNGFEDLVPKTHQPYIDPGTGTPQPNSWTMRGSSLPDHVQSNPTPWTVSSTVSDPSRALSASGIIKLDTTAENSAYYATTSATAPWDLAGGRAVSLRFRLLAHDATNGTGGAFQFAAGDGTRTWTCKVAPTQINVQGTNVVLPVAQFPAGLVDGKFHTLQLNFSGSGNDALVSIDGEVLTTTAAAHTGTLNGIAFGDPGAGISGKFETESLGFENSDLRYQYGISGADDYADTDEIAQANNILLYLRSKGQAFKTSAVASWLKLLDPNAYEWILEEFTGKKRDGTEQKLYIFTGKDIWLGSTVQIKKDTDYGSYFNLYDTKVTNTLVLDKEETKVWSSDQTRNEMQLTGILMAWIYDQDEYKEWLAEKEGGGTGIDGLLVHKKHITENIVKCAKGVETTISVGGEIVASMTNEYVDYAITINNVRQGDYMAMVGFIPLVPSSTARAIRFINKVDGTEIDGLVRMMTKFPDFPIKKIKNHVDDNGITRNLDVRNLFADHTDSNAVDKMRRIANNEVMSAHGPGNIGGHELLSTFSNQAVICFKTKEPTKAYRVFDSINGRKESNFLLLEPPISKAQAEADYALGSIKYGSFQKNYDSWIEIEIPAGSYVFTGVASKMDGKWVGGGRQVWIEDDVVNGSGIDWANAVVNVLPPK